MITMEDLCNMLIAFILSVVDWFSSTVEICLHMITSFFYLLVGLLFLVAFILLLNRIFPHDSTATKTLITFTIVGTVFFFTWQKAKSQSPAKPELEIDGHL